jgi:hypothetical protein
MVALSVRQDALPWSACAVTQGPNSDLELGGTGGGTAQVDQRGNAPHESPCDVDRGGAFGDVVRKRVGAASQIDEVAPHRAFGTARRSADGMTRPDLAFG